MFNMHMGSSKLYTLLFKVHLSRAPRWAEETVGLRVKRGPLCLELPAVAFPQTPVGTGATWGTQKHCQSLDQHHIYLHPQQVDKPLGL